MDFFSLDESLEQVRENLAKETTRYENLRKKADEVQERYDEQSAEIEKGEIKSQMLRNELEHSYKNLTELLLRELKTLEALNSSKEKEIALKEQEMKTKAENLKKQEEDLQKEKKRMEDYQNRIEKKESNLNKFSEQLEKATQKLQANQQ